MFNWKKHCFIWLSLLSFPLLSTYLQNPADAYTVIAPFENPPSSYDVLSAYTNDLPIQHGWLRDLPFAIRIRQWSVWTLYGREGYSGIVSTYYGGEEVKVDSVPLSKDSVEPESYGCVSYSEANKYVLAIGGWEEEGRDYNFRFLTIDLNDFTNLQAVGRNAFENLGHQNEVTDVTEITVPDKCSQIEEYAWKNCTFLKKVTFLCPNITYMSPLAFDGCYDTLEEVRIVAAENTTEDWLKNNIVSLKSAGQQALLPENPKDWTESDRSKIQTVAPVNTVTDFVATFEGHGFSWTIENAEDGNGRFIVLRKSPLSVNNNSVDIAEKENVLIDKQVYSSHDQSILTEDLKITAPDGTELPDTDYDIYLRWVKDGETSEWVKYVDKDSLKVRDAGTYTIQYVVYYKGNNPDLKSNPEGLNVTEDENGGIQIEISENEDSSKPTEVSEPPVEPQESNEDDISNSESENQSEDDSQTPDSSS